MTLDWFVLSYVPVSGRRYVFYHAVPCNAMPASFVIGRHAMRRASERKEQMTGIDGQDSTQLRDKSDRLEKGKHRADAWL